MITKEGEDSTYPSSLHPPLSLVRLLLLHVHLGNDRDIDGFTYRANDQLVDTRPLVNLKITREETGNSEISYSISGLKVSTTRSKTKCACKQARACVPVYVCMHAAIHVRVYVHSHMCVRFLVCCRIICTALFIVVLRRLYTRSPR